MTHLARTHFFVSLVLLIIAGGAYYFWFSYVSGLSDRAGALVNEIDQRSQDSARSSRAKNAGTELSASETALATRFISKTYIVPYLESVQSTGKSLGTVVKVASVAENDGSPVGHLALALTVTGSFENVVRTLGVLENESIDSSLGSVSLTSSAVSSSSSTPTWSASTILTIGVQTGATGTGQIDGVKPTFTTETVTPKTATTTATTSPSGTSELPTSRQGKPITPTL